MDRLSTTVGGEGPPLKCTPEKLVVLAAHPSMGGVVVL